MCSHDREGQNQNHGQVKIPPEKQGGRLIFLIQKSQSGCADFFSENHKNNIESVIIQFSNILYFIDQNYVKSVT